LTKRKKSKKRTKKQTVTRKKYQKIFKSLITSLAKDRKIEKTTDVVEAEVAAPSYWLRAVQKQQNVAPSHIWYINKEEIYQHYHGRFKVYNGPDGVEKRQINTTLGEENEVTCNHSKYSHEELVLPNGKVITPIRQFCETKILPRGTKEAFFFDFGKVTTFNDVTEGTEVATVTPTITSSRAETEPRGTRVTIGYTQTEEEPVDIIAALNRSFSLESIADESIQVMNAANNSYETSHWIDSRGNKISDDVDEKGSLSIFAVRKALNIIMEKGLDPSNIVLYTTGKGLVDMVTSYEARKHDIYDIITLEKYLGIKLIRSSACYKTREERTPVKENIFQRIKRIWFRKERGVEIKGGNGRRSILFIPNITFGLVSGRDLIVEAQRRNELQAIHVTGTQRVTAIVKNKEGLVLISHA